MQIAAFIYSFFTVIVCLFQLALAAGAPWGEAAMGGKYPGKFPTPIRILAIVQFFILALLSLIVLSKSGLILAIYAAIADKLIWVVVAFCALSLLGNLATPSKIERMLWAPVAAALLVTSLIVALI